MFFSEELQPFGVACEQNSNGLVKAFYECSSVSMFLKDDDDVHIPIFASVVESAEEEMKYTFDLDGVVVLLRNVSCVKA